MSMIIHDSRRRLFQQAKKDKKLETLKERGLTIVITTHSMEAASRLCDRLVIIDHGKILVEGRPQQLIARYAGRNVVELEDPSRTLREYVNASHIEHDDFGRRVVLYSPEGFDLNNTARNQFCHDKFNYRHSSLEDVFLKEEKWEEKTPPLRGGVLFGFSAATMELRPIRISELPSWRELPTWFQPRPV